MHKVKIADKGDGPYGYTRIWIDDLELRGVVSVQVNMGVGELVKINLELMVEGIETISPDLLNKIEEKKDINRFELMDIDK